MVSLAPALLFVVQSTAPPPPLPWHEQRPVAHVATIARFAFDGSADGFVAVHACVVAADSEGLQVCANGDDPYLHSPLLDTRGPDSSAPVDAKRGEPLELELRARASRGAHLRVYWTTRESPQWSEQQSCDGELIGDGSWHSTRTPLPIVGTLLQLRLDPFDGAGTLTLDSLLVHRTRRCPVRIESVESSSGGGDLAGYTQLRVRNDGSEPADVRCNGELHRLAAGASTILVQPHPAGASGRLLPLDLTVDGFPPFIGTLCPLDATPTPRASALASGRWCLEVDPSGNAARLFCGAGEEREVIAWIAPLLAAIDPVGGGLVALPNLRVVRRDDHRLQVRGDGATLDLEWRDDELVASVRAERSVEGPVVRTSGAPTRALFCGLEFLEARERSSSSLDLEGAARLRYAPDPALVTWPLMAAELPRATLAFTWDRRDLRPCFAQPDGYNGEVGTRMSVRGVGNYTVRLRLSSGEEDGGGRLDAAIANAVRARGLPGSRPQRSREAQWRLCEAALDGPLAGPGGFGHCAEPSWPRHLYASFLATRWRMDGTLPDRATLAGAPLADGGSHLQDDAAWLLCERAEEWLARRRDEAASLRASQGTDGLWRESGPFARGHFEATALGLGARNAAQLLEHARVTGNAESRRAGLRAAFALEHFAVPRGAQTWELPLHAPDLLAAAHAVRACLLGAELLRRDSAADDPDGDRADLLLASARRHALFGLPFVYLWGERVPTGDAATAGAPPIDDYATIAAYAATNWSAPVWIGLPVQWCGIVYADAIARLPDEGGRRDAIDWQRIARGILATGEAMQHVDGPLIGCLPDAFRLADQVRLPASINPCALVNLRLQLEKAPHQLFAVRVAEHVVTAPWPLQVEADGGVRLMAPPTTRCEVVIDGTRCVTAIGSGMIELP